jgi:membrane protein DedA with SNARE-associated domain
VGVILASLDLVNTVSAYGYLAVFLFVGIESLGIPLPGETMLITAAIYAGATQRLSIAMVIAAAAVGAVVGDNIGYALGHWGGYRLLVRYGRYVRLDQRKVKVGRYVFLRYGAVVVFFGRFVSILRTYAAFLAGTTRMPWGRFLVANAAGGIVWSAIYGVAAYLLGNQIERLNRPLAIAFGAGAALAIVIFLLVLRQIEARLEETAERALPGPLPGYPGGGSL